MKKPTFKRFALVTGSSSGIGKEIALKLSQNGYTVFINFREDEIGANTVKNTIKKNGGESYIVKADITKETEVKNLFNEISKISKTLDVVINNSGIYIPEYIEQRSIETWDTFWTIYMGKRSMVVQQKALDISEMENILKLMLFLRTLLNFG